MPAIIQQYKFFVNYCSPLRWTNKLSNNCFDSDISFALIFHIHIFQQQILVHYLCINLSTDLALMHCISYQPNHFMIIFLSFIILFNFSTAVMKAEGQLTYSSINQLKSNKKLTKCFICFFFLPASISSLLVHWRCELKINVLCVCD